MLEKGPSDYHRPVMRLMHSYLKLQDCQAPEIVNISRDILAVVCQHIKVSSVCSFLLLLHLTVCINVSAVNTDYGVGGYVLMHSVQQYMRISAACCVQ